MVWLLVACAYRSADGEDPAGDSATAVPTVVPLRWVRGYADDTWDRARSGLRWQLMHLGAVPAADGVGITLRSRSDDAVRFDLDLAAVGLPPAALDAVAAAAAPLAASDDARLFGGVDLGAFFLRTVYDPAVYYRATGACPTLDGWSAGHTDGHDLLAYAVTESLLTDGDRLDRFVPGTGAASAVAHVVAEGEGSLTDGDFVAAEYETLDVLPNGMLRYAVYGVDGALRPWSEASPAGQPGKCMWCHEDHLQRGLKSNPSAPGYLDATAFLAEVDAQTAAIAAARAALPTAELFDPPDAHTWGELLTETWLQPSAARLARAWTVDPAEVDARAAAAGFGTHTDDEYPEFGPLYARADADALLAAWLPELVARPAHPLAGADPAYAPLVTASSAREPQPAVVGWGGFACP